MKTKIIVSAILLAGLLSACEKDTPVVTSAPVETDVAQPVEAETPSRFDIYAEVGLSADLSHLSDGQRQMIGLLIDVWLYPGPKV